MEIMQNLRIDNLLGVWKSDKYTLTILPTRIVLIGNSIRGIDESIRMNYIADKNEYYNTIQLSDSINLFQLLSDNEIVLKLKNVNGKNDLICEVFNRVGFENEFSFYLNIEVPSINKYRAIRWYSPWEYITLFEICDYSIIKLITGKDEDELKLIRTFYYEEGNDKNKWIKIDFHSHFADFRQKELIREMQEALIEKK